MNRSSHTGRQVLPLRERLKGETQRAILEAAEEVFGESGLSGARMEDIAGRAGVSVGTLYNHFKDRDALLKDLIVARREELLARLDGVLRPEAAEMFPSFLMALLKGTLSRELSAPTDVPLASRAPALVLFFLHGAGA